MNIFCELATPTPTCRSWLVRSHLLDGQIQSRQSLFAALCIIQLLPALLAVGFDEPGARQVIIIPLGHRFAISAPGFFASKSLLTLATYKSHFRACIRPFPLQLMLLSAFFPFGSLGHGGTRSLSHVVQEGPHQGFNPSEAAGDP